MYKIITHTIIEEHFDNPADIANAMVSSDTVILRTYPNGTVIPSSLPYSYVIATTDQNCGNCLAFSANSANSANIGNCLTYCSTVRPEYVCATWKPVVSTT